MFHFQVLLALCICFELLSLFSYRILVNNHLLKIIFWTAFQYVLFVFFSFHASSLRDHPKTTCAVGVGGIRRFFSIGPHSKPGGKSFLTNIWIQSSTPPSRVCFENKTWSPHRHAIFLHNLFWNCTIEIGHVCVCVEGGSGVLKTDTRWGVREKRARGFWTIPTLCSFPRLKINWKCPIVTWYMRNCCFAWGRISRSRTGYSYKSIYCKVKELNSQER